MQRVPLTHGEVALFGELYAPADARALPGVIVMHTGLGLGPFVRGVADRLAGLGYAALVTDMFGGDFGQDPVKAGARFQALIDDRVLLRDRAVRWFDHFATLPEVDAARIAAIGYCFGGLCVLELARSGADVKLVSSFHGLLSTHAPAEAGRVKAQVAVWCGGRDPYAPTGAIDRVRAEFAAAGANMHLTLFDEAEHGFTDPESDTLGRPGIGYHQEADAASWAGTVALLAETLQL